MPIILQYRYYVCVYKSRIVILEQPQKAVFLSVAILY
jgi:hypothetical protein